MCPEDVLKYGVEWPTPPPNLVYTQTHFKGQGCLIGYFLLLPGICYLIATPDIAGIAIIPQRLLSHGIANAEQEGSCDFPISLTDL